MMSLSPWQQLLYLKSRNRSLITTAIKSWVAGSTEQGALTNCLHPSAGVIASRRQLRNRINSEGMLEMSLSVHRGPLSCFLHGNGLNAINIY